MAQIGNCPFETAASLCISYTAAPILFLHLGLERPDTKSVEKRDERVLIWGISSSLGAVATQLASQAGYAVVGVASGHHTELGKSLGLAHFVDRTSPTVVDELVALGPFKAVLSAADSPEDRGKVADVVAAHGGGEFIVASGPYQGTTLPDGVRATSRPFVADLMDEENKNLREWLFWNYLEDVIANDKLKSLPLDVKTGFSHVEEAWNLLREGKVSGKRVVIIPDTA